MGPCKRLMKVSFLTLMLLISFSFVVFPIHCQARPKIFVEPKDNKFSTDPTAPNYKAVGDTFVVKVSTSGWESPGLYSFEFKLYFDTTLLDVVKAEYPAGHFFDFTPDKFMVTPVIDTEKGYVLFGGTLLGEVGATGSGTFAQVTLKIIQAPPAAKSVSCDLKLNGITFLDPEGNTITAYDVVHGYYEYAAPKPPMPYLKVSPPSVSARTIGEEVSIDITIQALSTDWKAVGFQWKLTFDPSLLEYVNATEGDFLKAFGSTYFYALSEDNYVLSFHLLYKEPWPPEVFPEGSGVLATIKFKALGIGSCDLTLSDTLIVNVNGELVETGPPESGKYSFSPPWYLSVEPKEVEVAKEGDTFNLNVLLNNIAKDVKLVGLEFKLLYNNTLLETSEDMITEGDFLKDFARRVGTDTWFQAIVEPDVAPGVGLVGIIILPLPNGTWPYDVFPEGTGVLATFTFKAIYQHETEDITDYLKVADPLLASVDAKEIPVDLEKTATEGKCKYTILKKYVPPPPPAAEKVVDVYTQYDYPYGGQGRGVPSDAFAPQGQAKLIAKVTYRGDVVPNKPVAYQIRGPKGYEFLSTQFTDSKGEALLEFTVPASKAYFGIWNVTVSVDVAGQVVSDYVFFRVGYLISVKEDITIESRDGTMNGLIKLIKGKTYPVSSVLKVITMQPPEKCVQLNGLTAKTLLVFSGLDELTQPLFSQYIPTNVGYFMTGVPSVTDMARFVLVNGGREIPAPTTSITIPTSAFSGIAKIIGDVFTDFPWFRGVPYSESTIKQVWIEAAVRPEIISVPTTTAVLGISSATVMRDSDFTVDVTIKDVDADAHIVAMEFRVKFEPFLLDVLDVTEGNFVKQFGETFMDWKLDGDVLIGIIQLPPWPGPNGWMTGSGTIAQIKFHAKAGGSCVLALTSAFMVDNVGNTVNFLRLENGLAKITE